MMMTMMIMDGMMDDMMAGMLDGMKWIDDAD